MSDQKNNLSIRESMSKGFERGIAGKEENASQARILTSSQPLPNEVAIIRKGYIICLVLCVAGCIIPPSAAVGLFGLLIVYLVETSVADHKRGKLRRFKFKISNNVNYENLFETMQPIFISKYNMLVERRPDGSLSLSQNGYFYDVILEGDGTFTIWWRMSGTKAFFSINNYKSYKIILAAMGIIAFEIQKAMGVE